MSCSELPDMAKPKATGMDQSPVLRPQRTKAAATDETGAADRGTTLVAGADDSKAEPPSAAPPAPAKRMPPAKVRSAKPHTLLQKFTAWLVEQKLDPEKPHFDNTPLNFPKTFPEMTGQVAAAFLENRLWWWRKANEAGCAQIFHAAKCPPWSRILLDLYQDHFERSAYYYELRARYDNRYQWDFGHPWIHCSRQQRRMLDCLWPNNYPAQNWLPSDAGKPAWSRLDGVSFNLQLNDTVLIEQFLAEVERLRRSKAIRKPGVGQGVRRKPLSWRPIELLDIRRYRIRPLNDGERSHVSKVLRDYKAACQKARIEP